MRRIKLDRIDRKILKTLQENSDITNVELSKQVGISAPPCLRRVRALEENGFIKSYHANLDAQLLGYGLFVYAAIKLESQSESDLSEFQQNCNNLEQIRECHMLSGEVDFLLKIVAADWDSYQQFLTEKLTSMRNVTSVRTMPLVRSTKVDPGIPIDTGF